MRNELMVTIAIAMFVLSANLPAAQPVSPALQAIVLPTSESSNNDLTRWTIEWGDLKIHKNRNMSVTYKYQTVGCP